jgi:GNAT superfamily N-acetyltransferase
MTEEGRRLLKQKVANDLADSTTRIFIAEAGDETIGFAQGKVASRSDYAPRTVGLVSLVYVRKQFRRKGIGRHLVKELCRFFGSNKAEHLTVRYVISNKEAEGFWAKLGFEPIISTSASHLRDLKLN